MNRKARAYYVQWARRHYRSGKNLVAQDDFDGSEWLTLRARFSLNGKPEWAYYRVSIDLELRGVTSRAEVRLRLARVIRKMRAMMRRVIASAEHSAALTHAP